MIRSTGPGETNSGWTDRNTRQTVARVRWTAAGRREQWILRGAAGLALLFVAGCVVGLG
jgi:hypothetical protein